MALGDRIRQLRKEAGWSQAELGDKIGTDSQRVSRYETGKITPSLDAIVRIAEALNISIDHLLIDDSPATPCTPPSTTSATGSPPWPSSPTTTSPPSCTCSTPSPPKTAS
jgi:transcriptional regulator with XRE-family HTH domain